jgi:hypothetical protein
MAHDLFILRRDERDLYEYLTRHFAGRSDVRVILDRRAEERASRSESRQDGRPGTDRRSRSNVDTDLASLGFSVLSYR